MPGSNPRIECPPPNGHNSCPMSREWVAFRGEMRGEMDSFRGEVLAAVGKQTTAVNTLAYEMRNTNSRLAMISMEREKLPSLATQPTWDDITENRIRVDPRIARRMRHAKLAYGAPTLISVLYIFVDKILPLLIHR